MTSRNDRARMSDAERAGLTGRLLGNILARMGNDDPAEEADDKGEESDWYPYDDPSFDNASFEDEEAYLAAEELGLATTAWTAARGSVWGFRAPLPCPPTPGRAVGAAALDARRPYANAGMTSLPKSAMDSSTIAWGIRPMWNLPAKWS